MIRFYPVAGACERIDSLKTLLKIASLSLFMLYAGDYLWLRYRIPKNRDALGTVEIEVYYAVGLKNHKVEYLRADPETQTCARSLFPHVGYQPCWYVNRHRRKWIEIGRATGIPYSGFMPQVTLELPDDLSAFLSGSGQDLQRAALEAIALEAYREHKLSTARLRRLLGYHTRMQVHAFLKEHGAYLHYDLADLEHDRQAGDALGAPPAA